MKPMTPDEFHAKLKAEYWPTKETHDLYFRNLYQDLYTQHQAVVEAGNNLKYYAQHIDDCLCIYPAKGECDCELGDAIDKWKAALAQEEK